MQGVLHSPYLVAKIFLKIKKVPLTFGALKSILITWRNPHNIRRGIRFDKQLDERLRNYCEAHQASLGSTVRTAVEFFLDAHEGK